MNCFITVLVLSGFIFAKGSRISGKVFDIQTDEPIVFAQIYFNNTTIGTTSNQDGYFEIKNIPEGTYELIVSMMGYKVYKKFIEIDDNSEINRKYFLIEQDILLEDVEVVEKKPDIWFERLDSFKKALFGTTDFSTECVIENPEVLSFYKTDNPLIISAKARDYLIIINNALGFKISARLNKFKWNIDDNSVNKFITYEYFDLDSVNSDKSDKWHENRIEAYRGSLIHFLRSLAENKLEEEGFKLYPPRLYVSNYKELEEYYNKIAIEEYRRPTQKDLRNFICKKVSGNRFEIKSDFQLIISFENPPSLTYKKELEYKGGYYRITKYQRTNILSEIFPLEFSKNGQITSNNFNLSIIGYMGWERLADRVPVNYKSNN